MKSTALVCCIIALLFISCATPEATQEELVKYVEDEGNGLKIKEEVGEFVFTLQYKPIEYMAINELGNKNGDTTGLAGTKEALSEMEQFNLTIESKDGKTEMLKNQIQNDEDYFRRIEYFSMAAEKDIKMISGKDTLPCVLYHFERSYDITPYSKMVIGFKKNAKENIEDRVISFNESILGIGTINFRVKNKDIKNIPQLIVAK